MARKRVLPDGWQAPDGWSAAPTYTQLSASSDGRFIAIAVGCALYVGSIATLMQGSFGLFVRVVLVIAVVIAAAAVVIWCVAPRSSIDYIQHYPHEGATTWVMETITTRRPSPLERLVGRTERSSSSFEEREGRPAPDFP